MSKTKMRCIACGKWFQSANAKEVTCPDCTQKARKEKLAAKNAPPTANRPVGLAGQAAANSPVRPPAPPKPKSAQGGTNQWLDKLEDVKVSQPEQPPSRPKIPSPPVQRDNRGPGGFRGPNTNGPNAYRDDRGPSGPPRGPAAYRVGSDTRLSPSIGQRPRQPSEGGYDRGPAKPWQKDAPRGGQKPKPRPKAKPARPAAPPKPKREKTPPPPPFVPTPEQITQVEERYIELANPAEFDGIRTQIAQEIGIPKKAVKKIIKDLRARQNIPSWWELQIYKGSSEELEKIKAAYEPYLPVPPVGVHKKIADTLLIKPGTIYQAIKTIRQEMNLPQYNDPTLHEQELAALRARRSEQAQAQADAASTTTAADISTTEAPVEQTASVTTATETPVRANC